MMVVGGSKEDRSIDEGLAATLLQLAVGSRQMQIISYCQLCSWVMNEIENPRILLRKRRLSPVLSTFVVASQAASSFLLAFSTTTSFLTSFTLHLLTSSPCLP